MSKYITICAFGILVAGCTPPEMNPRCEPAMPVAPQEAAKNAGVFVDPPVYLDCVPPTVVAPAADMVVERDSRQRNSTPPRQPNTPPGGNPPPGGDNPPPADNATRPTGGATAGNDAGGPGAGIGGATAGTGGAVVGGGGGAGAGG